MARRIGMLTLGEKNEKTLRCLQSRRVMSYKWFCKLVYNPVKTQCYVSAALHYNIFAVPYGFLGVELKFLFIEPLITENNGSTYFYPAANQSFALSLFWQSGWTLCGEVLEGGAGGGLH